jgi:hypothetical protein
MSPTYTVHRGQRYRYYTCQGALRRRDQQAGSRRHVGAEEVEALVVEMLARALPGAALGTNIAVGNLTADTRIPVRDTVERVVVRGNEIEIVINSGDRTLKALGQTFPTLGPSRMGALASSAPASEKICDAVGRRRSR